MDKNFVLSYYKALLMVKSLIFDISVFSFLRNTNIIFVCLNMSSTIYLRLSVFKGSTSGERYGYAWKVGDRIKVEM
jgi:hypothetical protein